MNGFINVLKPAGATASDIVVCLKHVLHQKKIGHLGTLDPGACGVLPVAIGQATKLFNFLTDKVKYYRAYFTFGKTTDTLDSYGQVTHHDGVLPSKESILKALESLVGEIDQVPPAYSAISVGGVRAYKLARGGEEVQLKSRKVTIYKLELLRQFSDDTFVIDIQCSAGTYIRSIVRDIACACGCLGYMSALIRLKSGCFDIEHAYTLDQIKQLKEQCIESIMYPLSDVEVYTFDDESYWNLDHGIKTKCFAFDGYKKIYCKGEFFGLGKCVDGFLKLEYYLKGVE